MPLLQWNQTYSVGVAEFDRQHQRWIDLLNALHDALSKGQGTSVVGPVLEDAIDYTKTHFAAEERLMKQHGFPGFAEHKSIHDRFIRQIEELRQAHGTVAAIKAMTVLREWLVQHISAKDKSYGPFFSAKGVS